MMTLRRYLIGRYDWTGIAARIARSPLFELGANLLVAAATLLLGWAMHRPAMLERMIAFFGSNPAEGHPCLAPMIAFDTAVLGLAVLALLTGAVRMTSFVLRREGTRPPLSAFVAEGWHFLSSAVVLLRLRHCGSKLHWLRHLFQVLGVGVMLVLVFGFLPFLQTDAIYPIYHPQRWLGYLATAAIVYSMVAVLVGRARRKEQLHEFSEPTDWVVPVQLLLVALSGIGIHILRYAGASRASLYMYAAHMAITVPFLLVEVPFGKLSHVVYRPLAVYLQAVTARARRTREAEVPAAVAEGA